MNFLARLFGIEDEKPTAIAARPEVLEPWEPRFRDEQIPGAFDLGLYYSENKDEVQVAKIAEKDRATHLYVVGATGTGKTKFLESLIFQDVEKGSGFGVIDPHGDLIEDIKGYLACRYCWNGDEREVSERVVLVDPTDPGYTVTFNPLEQLPGVSVAEQAGELVSAFRKIWSDSWGARMEDLMRNTLIALGEAELTLAELPAFLTHRAMRKVVLEKVTNSTTRDYFRRFDTLTDRGQITWIEPVMNKINAFLADERMRQVFSSNKSSFNVRDIIDTRKCLLVKLDKGKLKDAGDLLGSLIMAKLQMAAFSRSDISAHKRTSFYLYIDEFQNYAGDSFKVVLSEARKYGLSLIMAHQTLSQISDELRSLILGSAGIQVYFRINRQDANLLAKEAFYYSGSWEEEIEKLQHLPPQMCYVKHKIQGGIIQLHTMKIDPAWEMLGMSEYQYDSFLQTVPFGRKYLIRREDLVAQTCERLRLIEETVKARQVEERKQLEAPAKPSVEEVERRPVRKSEEVTTVHNTTKPVPMPPERDIKAEREHRRLQNLIKLTAEKNGYRAVIEQPTPDGQGRVDVGLERDGRKEIACEVSITTSAEQELGNIEKCIRAGYDRVFLCSPERKTLEKVKTFVAKEVAESDRDKILFLLPEELLFLFEEEAASAAGKEERIKGYKVKVNYQPVQEAEKRTKRQAIAQVFLKSFRRKKDGE